MIRTLRRKFTLILMCVTAPILLAVFALMLLSLWNDNRRARDDMFRQALYSPLYLSEHVAANSHTVIRRQSFRTPILVAALDDKGGIVLIINELHFMDNEEARAVVEQALKSGEISGVLDESDLRWLKSEDNRRIALADVSAIRETLRSMFINALLIAVIVLIILYFISSFLARWAVRPIALAWESQRQFVADASHELKTPLTVILSNAEMLKDVFDDNKKARRIEHIHAEAGRMRKLVEDLLTLAESDSTKRLKVWERVDFGFIVMSAVLTYESVVFDENKKLNYDVPNNIFVMGDTRRLSQLVSILLDNAVKYCPAGGKISVKLSAPDKKNVRLEVSNDGEPIPKDELQRVFERFYRVDKARSAHGSFGLGLSIARSIAIEHSGKIWADSGEQNVFSVTLPTV